MSIYTVLVSFTLLSFYVLNAKGDTVSVNTTLNTTNSVNQTNNSEGCRFNSDCNNGFCINSECLCKTGWSGVKCTIKDLCKSVNCYNGKCNNETGECNCLEGWYKPYCNIMNCGDNGIYDLQKGTCVCAPGFIGARCETCSLSGIDPDYIINESSKPTYMCMPTFIKNPEYVLSVVSTQKIISYLNGDWSPTKSKCYLPDSPLNATYKVDCSCSVVLIKPVINNNQKLVTKDALYNLTINFLKRTLEMKDPVLLSTIFSNGNTKSVSPVGSIENESVFVTSKDWGPGFTITVVIYSLLFLFFFSALIYVAWKCTYPQNSNNSAGKDN